MLIRFALWQVKKEVQWFIGYVREILNGGYTVEHLHQSPSTQNNLQNYPSPDDKQSSSEEHIITCKTDGDWEPTNNTSTRIDFKFRLRNSSAIENTFKILINLLLMLAITVIAHQVITVQFTKGFPEQDTICA